jgi:Tannase-like family of unknown function (DUF6351)
MAGFRCGVIVSATVLFMVGALAHAQTELRVVSSRPDMVSGETALVEMRGGELGHATALLNGKDVTAQFHQEQGIATALLTGLKQGKNILEVKTGSTTARIEMVDYPITGPIFSGKHQQPFICQAELNGLGAPQDADCSAATRVEYYYKPKEPVSDPLFNSWSNALLVLGGSVAGGIPQGFKVYDPEHPASDVAQAVTTEGRTVPYVVRRELGVINRAVYDIRFLHVPGEPLPTPWARSGSAWNGRLVYELAGGCAAGYRQGTLLAPASHEAVLAKGYAVATSTLNIFGNNCDDVLSAETLSMVKERFIKTYGVPVHTIGWGDSGGAMQQYMIAESYPGLLDGIIPYISFPDSITYIPSTSDCGLLMRAFGKLQRPLTDEQKTAVTGFATWRMCMGSGNFAISARTCSPAIPRSEVYDAKANPAGARCTVYDNQRNIIGADPGTGFALRPLDNVGVEYGLQAFNNGKIDAEQFVALNEYAGGHDIDGTMMASRTVANLEGVQRAYEHGLVLRGGGGLRDIPIIDWRWYSDDQGDNHDSFRSFVTRRRMVAANGKADNQVILIYARANTAVMTINRLADPDPETSLFAQRERDLVETMNAWLDAVAADHAAGTAAEKVARDKPAGLADACWTTAGEKIAGADVFAKDGRCSQLYPQHGDTRIAADGPLTDDVVKCALKPVQAADFSQALSDAQLTRLKAVFPTGVCDYSKPGPGQGAVPTVWQRY